MDLHELTAGYALDALDPDEHAQYEAHLATCEPCRDELQGSGRCPPHWRVGRRPQPPAALRSRILEQARNERPKVVPLRPQVHAARSLPAAVAAVAAIAIGIWAVGLSRELDDANDRLAVLGDPNAQVFETAKGEANLVVTPSGQAALVVRMLAGARGQGLPDLVFENGVPKSAGLFERPGVTRLTRPVEPGQTVAVTVEPTAASTPPRAHRSSQLVGLDTEPSRSRDGCVPTASLDSSA